jgi:predicted site-specific integrase-resolvase
MEQETFLTPLETSKILNVATRTLFTWQKEGKIKCIRTSGNHKRYLLSSFPNYKPNKQQRKICYCRVSSHGQKEDLERQVKFFKNIYPDYEIIKDIGSGLNFKRKGFKAILDSAIKGNIGEIVVTHRDRLCRFGFELIEQILSHSNGKIVVLDREETSPEKELVNDLISIVTVFSPRVYGLRSHSIKTKIREAVENNEV